MSPSVLTFLGGLIGAVLAALAALGVAKISGRSTAKSAKEATAVTFAADLTKRLETVERQIVDLRAELLGAQRLIQAATGYIDALLWWLRTGRRGKMPHPPRVIRDHLDPNLLEPTEDESEPASP